MIRAPPKRPQLYRCIAVAVRRDPHVMPKMTGTEDLQYLLVALANSHHC